MEILINKSKGVATTKLSNKSYEEEFNTTSTNPIRNNDIWYDMDLIPSIAQNYDIGVSKYYEDINMVFVGVTEVDSTSFKVISSSGENLLQSMIYSVNGSNNTYKPIVKNFANVIISETQYNIDVGSGLLTFYSLPTGVTSVLPPKISFHQYTGLKGIPITPNVVDGNNLSGYSAIYKQNIQENEPGMDILYYFISNTNNTKQRAGYLNINYSNRVATFTDTTITMNTPITLPPPNDVENQILFNVKVINGNYFVFVKINIDIWNVTIKKSNLLKDTTKGIVNNITNNQSILSFNSTVSNPLNINNVLGSIVYYTIIELPSANSNGFNTVKSGILKYTFTANNNGLLTVNVLVEETKLISIGDPSINDITFDYNRTFTGVFPNDESILTITVLNIPSGRNYKITTYYNTYKDDAIVINNINSTLTTVASIPRAISNYINYKYLLQDSSIVGIGSAPITLFGELEIIWPSNSNTVNIRNTFNNTTLTESNRYIGIIDPGSTITPPLLDKFNFTATIDNTVVNLNITIGTEITNDVSKTYNLYLIANGVIPIQPEPVLVPYINQFNNLTSTISPTVQTIVLHTLDGVNSNGALISYTVFNNNGTAKRTEEISCIYQTNIPSSLQSSFRRIATDLGDLSNINVYVRYLTNVSNSTNPEFVIDITSDVWNITFQIIDFTINNTITKTISNTDYNTNVSCDDIPISNKGICYYYLIKHLNGSNQQYIQSGKMFASFGNVITPSSFIQTVDYLYNEIQEGVITDPYTYNITQNSIFASLNVNGNGTLLTTFDTIIYLYRLPINSNTIVNVNDIIPRLDLSGTVESNKNNISTTKSVKTGDSITITSIDNSSYNIFEFDPRDTIIPKFSTLVNVDRNPERIISYMINYVAFSPDVSPADRSFITGELYLHFLNNFITVDDIRTDDTIRSTEQGTAFNDINFSAVYTGNEKYRIIVTNSNGIGLTYNLTMTVGLTLSNSILTNKLLQSVLNSGLNPNIINTYNITRYNAIKIFYTLISSGVTPKRSRTGILLITFTDTTVRVIDNNNLSTANYEIGDTSGVVFSSSSILSNSFDLICNINTIAYPQFWNLYYSEIFI